MTKYICWLIEDDLAFRAEFKARTGVNVQQKPLENYEQTRYMLGHPIDESDVLALEQEFDLWISDDVIPEPWTPKEQDIV